MYKPDDKDIDRLSKDAAEHYHAPGKPAWDALQQILDKELPQEKEKKRRGFLFFFLLLLGITVAGSGLWYGIQVNNKNKSVSLTNAISAESKGITTAEKQSGASDKATSQNEAGSSVSTPENGSRKNNEQVAAGAASNSNVKNKPAGSVIVPPSATTAASSKVTKNENVPVSTKEPDAAATAIVSNNIAKNKPATASAHAPAPMAKNTTALNITAGLSHASGKQLNTGKKFKNSTHTNSAELVATTQNSTRIKGPLYIKKGNGDDVGNGTANNTKSKRNKNKGNNIIADNTTVTEAGNEKNADVAANNSITDNTKKDSNTSDKKADKPVAQVTTKADTVTATTASPVTQIEKKDSAIAAKKKTKSKNDKAINIGLTAGFDYSTVKFTHGQSAGYNIGLMGGYQFSSHWSVYTGAIYTKKKYALNGSDYHPPKHYWTQYVDLQKVAGYCRMWEVPLLARYTFNPGAKTAFFASTGISSYFMREQQYDYDYKNMMGVPATASWNNDSSFNHVFSILHLSAGFEKNLGKHLNWQIEPYAKIPLGGVGFGNIKLSSFGVNFSVQYRRPVKR